MMVPLHGKKCRSIDSCNNIAFTVKYSLWNMTISVRIAEDGLAFPANAKKENNRRVRNVSI